MRPVGFWSSRHSTRRVRRLRDPVPITLTQFGPETFSLDARITKREVVSVWSGVQHRTQALFDQRPEGRPAFLRMTFGRGEKRVGNLDRRLHEGAQFR